MAITTTCPGCKSLFRLAEELAGLSVRCQKCERIFVVPLPTVGQGMPLPSVEEVEAPLEIIEENTPLPDESVPEPVLAELVPEAALVEPIIEAKAIAIAAPATPAAPERPPSRLWTAAAVGLFAFAFCATGAFAAIWVSAHLAPPPRVVLVPPLKERIRDPLLHLREQKDLIDRWGNQFKEKALEVRVQPTRLFFGNDNLILTGGRLEQPLPGIDNGRFGNNGPFRVYRLTLERDKRYNFYVKSSGFNPRIKIFRGDIEVAFGEFSAEKRVFVSYTPNIHADYTIWITSFPHQEGGFDLSVALEQPDFPKMVNLRMQPNAIFIETLRVQNPRDPLWNPTFGPYHEYRVTLEANVDYVFKINEKIKNASFRPVLQVLDNVWQNQSADQQSRRLEFPFRPRETGEFRFRVTAHDYGEGDYTFAIERKVAVKPPDNSKPLIRYLVDLGGNGRYEETHAMTGSDPLEPSALGRGPYREYVLTMTKGENYRVEVTSKRFPPMVSVFDENSKQLAHNKGAGVASIDFTPNQTGTYRIRAIATHPFDRGSYSIKIMRLP